MLSTEGAFYNPKHSNLGASKQELKETKWQLREVIWQLLENKLHAQVMGMKMTVYANEHGGWDCRIVCDGMRPEIETGFKTATEAAYHAETVLLRNQIKRDFKACAPEVTGVWVDEANKINIPKGAL